MPARSLVLVLALAACATNPDPRIRPIELVVLDGHGGWIVVTDRHGAEIAGELIAIDPGAVRVLGATGLVSVARSDVASARLWAWEGEHGRVGVWGGLGTLSTISHGYFLLISAPIWLITTGITTAVETYAPIVSYPGDGWDKLAIWARFPQGMPPGVYAGDLVQQHRAPAPPAAAPAPSPPAVAPAPPPPAAGSGAGSGSADHPPDP
jgi:hypothetical protein